MERKHDQLIRVIEEEMRVNAFDAAHDLRHHQRVLANCRAIVASENLTVNQGALEIAALIHDYKRGNDDERDEFVKTAVTSLGMSDRLAEEAIEIMSTHSYGESQKTLEQDVLFDADKLEYLRPERFESCLSAVSKGDMAKERWEWYMNAFSERIPNVRAMLHFEVSRKMFDDLADEFKEYVATEPSLAELRNLVI